MTCILVLFFLLLPGIPVSGQSDDAAVTAQMTGPALTVPAPEPAGIDPYIVIGMTPAELLAFYGPPAEVFPYRGALAEEDNVVFYYPDHSYFFFYSNRVWQVRGDYRFGGAICEILAGMTREEAETKLGSPRNDLGRSVIYRLPYESFPLKVRIVYEEGKVYDIYVYRGDY